MKNKGMSWGWIIFWLLVFWPVGLYLVINKMSVDKSAMMGGKTKTLSIIGWVLVIFGVLALFGALMEPSDLDSTGMFLVVGFIAGGALLLLKTSKIKKTAVKYKKYIDLIINLDNRSIDNIASATGLSYDVILIDLQRMIDDGYLKDAFLHQSNREIVFKKHEHVAETQTSKYEQEMTQSVRCPGCGANSVVKVGRVTECEYCGTPIQA
jgi:hypothetical protein